MSQQQPRRLAFSYELVGPGWARARLSDGANELEMYPSRLSDALGDLTWAVVALLNGALEQSCEWADEPGEWRWIMLRGGDQLNVTILRFEQTFSPLGNERGQRLFQSQCHLRQFAIQINNQLWNLVREHGLTGYADLWRHRFPEERWHMLGEVIRRSNR